MMNSITRMNLTAFLKEYQGKKIRYLRSDENYRGTTWTTIKKYINMTVELVPYKHYVDPYEDQLISAEGVLWDEEAELYYVPLEYHLYTIIGWKE